MRLIAIDPGNVQSAWVLVDGRNVVGHGIFPNEELLQFINSHRDVADECVIEMVASYGMAVGATVFETVYWIGRFAERWLASSGREAHRMVRGEVKMYLCGQMRAKDANVRQAVLDLYGGKEVAMGRKAKRGPLYGVRADEWQALALGLTWQAARRDRIAPVAR